MIDVIKDSLTNEELERIIFSNKRRKSIEYRKVMMRPVIVKGQRMIQAEYTFDKKVTHKNVTAEEAQILANSIVNDYFKQINIITHSEEIQILCSKVEKPMISRKPRNTEEAESKSHDKGKSTEDRKLTNRIKKDISISLENNRQKNYIIPDGVPCDFLIRLGVMGEDGNVFPRAYSKFRQINRYLEIVEDCYPSLGGDEGKTLKIIDFGCGKAYLTFALYHYLKKIKNRNVDITGLDLKNDVIELCSSIARDLNYDGLKFLMGDIADYTNDNADMVVTLHACDTATDYALINAVSWNTKVILSVPCCQHELFKQIKNDIHNPMLKHGILKDRLTEYLTDGLRALKLEAKGYDVALIEFTSLEHTARNIMIKAVKTRVNRGKMEKAQAEYERLRDFYNVNPTIDRL